MHLISQKNNFQHRRKIWIPEQKSPGNKQKTLETFPFFISFPCFVDHFVFCLRQGADRFYRSPLNAKEGPENEFGISGAIVASKLSNEKWAPRFV